MIALASDTRVWLAAGMTDMRKGFDGLAALVATTLEADPFSGHVFFAANAAIASNYSGTPVTDYAYSPSDSNAVVLLGHKHNPGVFI